jgi:hypothetical protein
MFGVLEPENGLEEALRKWAKKFNAEVDWIFVGALRTLWLWRNPEQRKALEWTPFQSSGGSPGVGERFEFSHPGWETRLVFSRGPSIGKWYTSSLNSNCLSTRRRRAY